MLAGGSMWRDSTNWLEGEPCVDRWRGVTCCSDTHPDMQGDACIAISGDVIHLHQPGATFPGGCGSGSVTGTRADAARCVVTGLNLAGNNLVGVLNESMGALTSLRRLDVSGNQLSGAIPRALSELPVIERVQLEDNAFEYHSTVGGAGPEPAPART